MKVKILLFCSFCLLLTSCRAQRNEALEETLEETLRPVMPVVNGGEEVIYHHAYALVYNERHEQASWVGYMLTRERANGTCSRQGKFRYDPAVKTGSANKWDYSHSGYSRGHLVPAGDMKWDSLAMDESFFMSNISPQLSAFNDGIWNRLENQVRVWSKMFDTLYIFTGPVITADDTTTIGIDVCITVPSSFYKVIYSPTKKQGIGFIVPHEASKARVAEFAVSVDSVEAATGIDFLHGIADEDGIESTLCLKCWKLKK